MTDADRFERPKPCNWCGEIFEHRFDCPSYRGPLPGAKKLVVPAHVKLVDVTVYNKLLSVLKELIDPVEHKYVFYPDYGDVGCVYCNKYFMPGDEHHKENCPILAGRKLLKQLK